MLRSTRRVHAHRGRGETFVETFCASKHRSETRLGGGLVQHIDAVTPSVAARNAACLSVQTHAHSVELSELTHGGLRAGERADAHSERQGALHATVNCTARRCQTGRLEREDLIRRELLLIEGLLLLLESLNLILNRDLRDDQSELRCTTTSNTHTCSAMIPLISPLLSFLCAASASRLKFCGLCC